MALTRVQSPTECPANTVQLRGAAALAYHSTDAEVLLEGRAGTGKSIGWLTKFHHLAIKYAGCRIALCRDTRKSMNESTLATFEEKVLGATHPLVMGGPTRANRDEYRYPNRSVIVPFGLDDPGKLFSTEWDIVFCNEVQQGVVFDAWQLFNRALRNNMIPYQQLAGDCNPGPPLHWANKRATPCPDSLRDASTPGAYRRLQAYNRANPPGPMRRLVSVHQDNPRYFDMQKWEWTLDGQAYLLKLGAMTGHNRQRMMMGRWVAAEGTVLPEFDEAKHVITPFTIPDSWPIILAYDPGVDHPTALIWMAVGENGCIYIIDEIYRGGLGIAEHARNVKEREKVAKHNVHKRYADPQMAFSVTAFSAKTIASQWKEYGINFQPWPRTGAKELEMIEAVRTRLIDVRIKVFATCQNTINEFQSWSWARDSKGNRPPGDDKPEDRNNHALDCIKGVVATNPSHTRTTTQVFGV